MDIDRNFLFLNVWHWSKQYGYISVTLDGIEIDVKLEQYENEKNPSSVIFVGIVYSVNSSFHEKQ